MGTARSVFFTVSSIIMIISGLFSLVVLAIIVNERLTSPSASFILLFIYGVLIIVYSVLDIISGINGLRYINRRSNSAVLVRMPEAAVIICLIAVILSLINGVRAWHAAAIIMTGIVVPDIFMYAAIKKSYV